MPTLAGMNQNPDILARVVAELQARQGSLTKVADESGIAYDTVLRIKNGEGDPSYGKVWRLAQYLKVTPGAVEQAA
jgi:transcriptional regulator with XRE-family HTH domain